MSDGCLMIGAWPDEAKADQHSIQRHTEGTPQSFRLYLAEEGLCMRLQQCGRLITIVTHNSCTLPHKVLAMTELVSGQQRF